MSNSTGQRITHEQLLPFRGLHDIDGICHVRVYERSGRRPVVIAGELDDNPGTTVGNGIEMVADAIGRAFFPDGREFLLIEHRPASRLGAGGRPTFQIVCPSGEDDAVEEDAGEPRRARSHRRTEIHDIDELVGCHVGTWPVGRYTAAEVGGRQGAYLRGQVAAQGRAAAERLIASLTARRPHEAIGPQPQHDGRRTC